MFRKNESHRQPPLLSPVRTLPEKQRQRLEQSWAGVFYREFFSRLDEGIFAVLYSEQVSRPNIPVNVLVGLEFLKAGHGWSDEEMYDQFQFNLQVRYALGLHDFDTGHFELRSVYNFRRRLSAYQAATGTDLLAHCFTTVTDEQLAAYGVATSRQRMDSSQISSAIADASRLELVLTGVQRLLALLDEEQQAAFAALLAPYQQERAVLLAYRVKGQEATRAALLAAGQVLATLLPVVGEHDDDEQVARTTAVVTRLFAENFRLSEAQEVIVKSNDEITSGALQSLDDLEATYRSKGGASYKGYVVNVTETCDPDNDLQLITDVRVAPNNTDDATLMAEALPDLCERTDLRDLYTDGGFGSPTTDPLLCDHGVELHQTQLRGRQPDPSRHNLADFDLACDAEGRPRSLGCPGGQIVPVVARSCGKFVARFAAAHCQACPAFQKACRVRQMKRHPVCQLNFTQEEVFTALRRQRHRQLRERPDNPRAAIEGTVRTLKHPHRGRLPVRGLRRVTDMLIGTAAMANIRSILRFHQRKRKRALERHAQQCQETRRRLQKGLDQVRDSFLSLCRGRHSRVSAT